MSSRYTILGHLAKGGMASVYLGRMSGSAGFSRLVAIKRLHPELANDRDFVAMLVDEARLAAQIRHTNVIDTLDLVASDGAFSLVLEYIDGDSLSALVRNAKKSEEKKVPLDVALAIMHGVLRGLEAAHDARGTDGHPLGVVHRDVSPQNVLVGIDGVPRVIDFGVAKAAGKLEATKPGEIRGKFSYMAPEQLLAKPITRQVDVYAAGVMLWELLTGERLFKAEDERAVCAAVLRGGIAKPSTRSPDVPADLDAIVLKATALDVGERYLTAREMLVDIEKHPRASDEEVGAWVRRLTIEKRAQRQRMVEGDASATDLRSIDQVMKELAASPEAQDAPEAPSASSLEIARPLAMPVPAPPPRSKLPLVALGAGAILGLVVVVVAMNARAPRPTPKEPELASTAPAPTPSPSPSPMASSIVVPPAVTSTEPAPPPRPSAQASAKPPAKKPNAKPPSSVDPASFQ